MATQSALDRLRKAANLEPIKKEVKLSDGSIFEMYVTPLTMAERERAQKQTRSDDANAFALQLLMNKALDVNGTKLFNCLRGLNLPCTVKSVIILIVQALDAQN